MRRHNRKACVCVCVHANVCVAVAVQIRVGGGGGKEDFPEKIRYKQNPEGISSQ